MNKIYLIPLLVIASLLLTSCSDDPTRPLSAPITGQVLDADGQAVPGAVIMLEYELPQGLGEKIRTAIRIAVPAAGRVRVWISDPCTRETICVLMDEEAPAGTLTVTWDGRDESGLTVASGVYRFNLEAEGETTDNDFLLMHGGFDFDADPASFRPHAVTNDDGRFSIAQGCLAFGFVSTAINESGQEVGTFTVSRNIKLFALHPDHPTGSSDWVTADFADGIEVSISLAR